MSQVNGCPRQNPAYRPTHFFLLAIACVVPETILSAKVLTHPLGLDIQNVTNSFYQNTIDEGLFDKVDGTGAHRFDRGLNFAATV